MRFLRTCLLVLLLAGSAHAQTASPYRTTVARNASQPADVYQKPIEHGALIQRIPAVTFSTRLRTEGRVAVRLFSRKNVTWRSSISEGTVEVEDRQKLELYQGEAVIRGIHYPAAASVQGEKVVLSFPGRERGSRGSRQRLFTLTVQDLPTGRAAARVASSPASVFNGKTCVQEHGRGVEGEDSLTIKPLAAMAPGPKEYRVLTLSTVADPELYARFGKNTNAHIAAVVNAAEVLFERQLGIRFRIVKQRAFVDSASFQLPQMDAGELLKAFANNPSNARILGINSKTFDQDVDIKHLFTGKDLLGATVGVGYIGSVCFKPEYAYALSEASVRVAAPYYFAHEVGHNLGARHDPAPWSSMSLMSPNILLGSSFSKVSIDQINEHLSYFPGCVELERMTINLATATLTLSMSRSRNTITLRGRLASVSQEAIRAAPIKISIGSRTVMVKTDNSGRFSYVVHSRGGRGRTVVFASTQGGEVRSRSLMVMGL